MQLHLVLPGLLWPAKALHDCARDLELPALGRLLGRGQHIWREALAPEDWLCREFNISTAGDSPLAAHGIATEDSPLAALRLLGEGFDPGQNIWLCADPSHLTFAQGRLILGSQAPDLSDSEMQALLQALLPRVAQIPGFLQLRAGAAGSGYAYLQLASPPAMSTTPPSAARGFSGAFSLPQGPQGPAWTRLGNEVQMLLHALPQNQEREAAGRLAVNSLWFWGAGALPPAQAAQPPSYNKVLGDDALLGGLARWSHAAVGPLPASANDLPTEGTTLACVNDLALATQAMDANRWRETLLRLERNWFTPIAAAFFSGRLKTLRLTALGPEATLDIHLRGRDRFRFWKKPRPLATLLP